MTETHFNLFKAGMLHTIPWADILIMMDAAAQSYSLATAATAYDPYSAATFNTLERVFARLFLGIGYAQSAVTGATFSIKCAFDLMRDVLSAMGPNFAATPQTLATRTCNKIAIFLSETLRIVGGTLRELLKCRDPHQKMPDIWAANTVEYNALNEQLATLHDNAKQRKGRGAGYVEAVEALCSGTPTCHTPRAALPSQRAHAQQAQMCHAYYVS